MTLAQGGIPYEDSFLSPHWGCSPRPWSVTHMVCGQLCSVNSSSVRLVFGSNCVRWIRICCSLVMHSSHLIRLKMRILYPIIHFAESIAFCSWKGLSLLASSILLFPLLSPSLLQLVGLLNFVVFMSHCVLFSCVCYMLLRSWKFLCTFRKLSRH